MTAALPMGGQKITGAADPTVATDVATKNYVDTTTATFFSTGDVKLTFKIVADAGWLLFDDGTFGNVGSGSSSSNSAANLALFTLFFNAPFIDAFVPIFTSGGGATTRAAQVSASAAWAANCRMSLPKTLGRALCVAGTGSGLTARTLGGTLGEETHLLTAAEIPAHTHPITDPGHVHSVTVNSAGGSGFIANSGPGSAGSVNTTSAVTGITVNNNTGGGGAHNNMPPSTYLNIMVKI